MENVEINAGFVVMVRGAFTGGSVIFKSESRYAENVGEHLDVKKWFR